MTSVQDLAAPTEDILQVKRRTQNGELVAPTVYVAGPDILHGDQQTPAQVLALSSVEELGTQVGRLIDGDVDVIKVFGIDDMPPQELEAIVDLAHSHGIKVTTHGRSDDEIRAVNPPKLQAGPYFHNLFGPWRQWGPKMKF